MEKERKIINKNDIQAFFKWAIKTNNDKDECYMYLFDDTSDDTKKGDYLYLLKQKENNKNKYFWYIYVNNVCVFWNWKAKDETVLSNFNTLTGELYDYLVENNLIKIPYETKKALQLESLVEDLDLHGIFKEFVKTDEDTERLLYSKERSAILKYDRTQEFKDKVTTEFWKEDIKKIQKLAGEFNKNPSTSTREAIAIAKLVLNHTKNEYLGKYYQNYLSNKSFYWNYILVVLKKEKEMFNDIKKKYIWAEWSIYWKVKEEPYLDENGLPSYENWKLKTYQSMIPTLENLGYDNGDHDWLLDIYMQLGAHLDTVARSFDPDYNNDSWKKEVKFETYIYNEIKKKIESIWMSVRSNIWIEWMTLNKQDASMLNKFWRKLDFVLSKYYSNSENIGTSPDEKFIAEEINNAVKEAHKKREASNSDFISEEGVKQLLNLKNQEIIWISYQSGDDEEVELPIESEDYNPRKVLLAKEENQFADRIFNTDKFFKRERLTMKLFDMKQIEEGLDHNGNPNPKVQILKSGILMLEQWRKDLEKYMRTQEKDEEKKDKLLKVLEEINTAKSKSVNLQRLLEIRWKKLKEFESPESKEEINNLFEGIIDTYNHIGENLFEDWQVRTYLFRNYSINPMVFPKKDEKSKDKFSDYLDDIYKKDTKIDLMKSLYFVFQLEDVEDWEKELFVLSVVFHNTNIERIKFYLETKYKNNSVIVSTSWNQINRICYQILIKLKYFILDLFEKDKK